LLTFAVELKIKRLHINQILTVMMLWVFSLAITPWSALHHHANLHEGPVEKHCTHKLHLKSSQESCLICKAHFEKNYTLSEQLTVTYLESFLIARVVIAPSSAYTALISTSLRGPPVSS
jgi:hypothetical protein